MHQDQRESAEALPGGASRGAAGDEGMSARVSGRHARGAEQSDVLAWIAACGGEVVQSWVPQNLVAVDV